MQHSATARSPSATSRACRAAAVIHAETLTPPSAAVARTLVDIGINRDRELWRGPSFRIFAVGPLLPPGVRSTRVRSTEVRSTELIVGVRHPATATLACLVIDELPWLSELEPSIEGLLQTAWDRQLGHLPMLPVLIGSDLRMMEALERYDRPLHGRVRP
jgi:hypothetical protein